jgi:hypothetical protein
MGNLLYLHNENASLNTNDITFYICSALIEAPPISWRHKRMQGKLLQCFFLSEEEYHTVLLPSK